MERLKCKIYKQLIENQLKVQIEDGVDELIEEISGQIFHAKKSTKRPRRDIQPENILPMEETKNTLHKLGDNLPFAEETRKVFWVFDRKASDEQLEKAFQALKDSKSYNQTLVQIQNLRSNYQSILSPAKYADLLQEHLQKIKEIFLQKNFPEKKISSSIYPQFFTALDYRLLLLGGFHKLTLDPEDIIRFKFCQKLSCHKNSLHLQPFNKTSIINNFLNYSIALCSLNELVQNIFLNPNASLPSGSLPSGSSSIIYVTFNETDDYAFYTLSKVENENRFWSMDCRLENLTLDLGECILEYCIHLFRTLYKACLDTNDYIPNYQSKSCVLEYECEQLFQNIIIASDFSKLNLLLRKEVMASRSHSATPFDKFDLKTEDREQEENFKKYKLSDEVTKSVLKRMFDDIEESDLALLSTLF